jgi:hypothetical protein
MNGCLPGCGEVELRASRIYGAFEMARFAHPDRNGSCFLIVLAYKFDESYKNARTLVVGGWIGEEDQWKDLQREWCSAISFENETLPDGSKISRYHASEMNARDHEFSDWDDKRMLRFTKRLLDIVGHSGMTAITCGMDLAAFLELFPHRDPPDYGVAYGMCMKQIMILLGQAMETWEPEYRVTLIHDHSQWDSLAHDGFYQYKNDPSWQYGDRFVTITPLSSYGDVGLQAADLIAYEAMRWLDDNLWTENDMRKPLQELLKKTEDVNGFYFTRSYLMKFKKLLAQGG